MERPLPPDTPSVLTDYSPPQDRDRIGLHVGLFVATFLSMVWAGGTWVGRIARWPEGLLEAQQSFGAWAAYQVELLQNGAFLADGFIYAVAFISFLTVHEFGHYLTARWWRARVSLPYYIPVPFPASLGTLGAVIRIKEPLRRTRQLFDIGAAGPLAGFVVALGVLLLGTFTLPPAAEVLLEVGHIDDAAYYVQQGDFPSLGYVPPGTPPEAVPQGVAYLFGDTPLYALVNGLGAYEVPAHEMMHYPLLLAGWLGLFFTALNLLPVGQLDGGHIVYALFGPRVHAVVARVATLVLLLSGGLGFIGDMAASMAGWQLWTSLGLIYALAFARLFEGEWRLVVPAIAGALALTGLIVTTTPGLAASVGWFGWLVWVGLILFVIRVDHPPVQVEEALTPARAALGYLCLGIFALCFSIQPIMMG